MQRSSLDREYAARTFYHEHICIQINYRSAQRCCVVCFFPVLHSSAFNVSTVDEFTVSWIRKADNEKSADIHCVECVHWSVSHFISIFCALFIVLCPSRRRPPIMYNEIYTEIIWQRPSSEYTRAATVLNLPTVKYIPCNQLDSTLINCWSLSLVPNWLSMCTMNRRWDMIYLIKRIASAINPCKYSLQMLLTDGKCEGQSVDFGLVFRFLEKFITWHHISRIHKPFCVEI